MQFIETIDQLEKIYETPSGASLIKVCKKLTPGYQAWIKQSKLCILSTVGPEGTDASPRGDDQPVARILDDETLAMPDWRGNNRIDSLRNIVRDERVSLIFSLADRVTMSSMVGPMTILPTGSQRMDLTYFLVVPGTMKYLSVHTLSIQKTSAQPTKKPTHMLSTIVLQTR